MLWEHLKLKTVRLPEPFRDLDKTEINKVDTSSSSQLIH